jgi:hypothetical protein
MGRIAYRDKKVVGVFVRFLLHAPLLGFIGYNQRNRFRAVRSRGRIVFKDKTLNFHFYLTLLKWDH